MRPPVLPDRRNARAGKGEPAATGSEVSHPIPSAHLEAEEGNSHFSNRGFLCSLAPDWQDLEQFPKGGRDMGAKRGCEKSLLCLMAQAANFSHPRQVLVFFLTAARRRFRPPAQHHAIKIKTAGGHTAAPAGTYKPWDRPASRSLRHNVCNASIPSVTGPRPAPAISAESAQRINYNSYIPQYIVSVNIIVLLFCVFYVSVMKLSSGGKQSKRIVCILLAY